MCGATKNEYEMRIRPFGLKLFGASRQELGGNVPVPPLEMPLHVSGAKYLLDSVSEVVRFAVKTRLHRCHGLRRKGHATRDVRDEDHLHTTWHVVEQFGGSL